MAKLRKYLRFDSGNKSLSFQDQDNSNQNWMPPDLTVCFACSLRINQWKKWGVMNVTVWHLLVQNVASTSTPKHTFVLGKFRILLGVLRGKESYLLRILDFARAVLFSVSVDVSILGCLWTRAQVVGLSADPYSQRLWYYQKGSGATTCQEDMI